MGSYWAAIQQGENGRIMFYTERKLHRQGRLPELRALQKQWKNHKRLVSLQPAEVDRLARVGVIVLMPRFLALQGTWHWFTGHTRMDAFRLAPTFESALRQKGCIPVPL